MPSMPLAVAPAISVSPKSKSFTHKGGTAKIMVSLSGWTGSQATIQPVVTQGTNWLHLAPPSQVSVALTNGKGVASISYTVDATNLYLPSSNLGQIQILAQDVGASASFAVTQTGKPCTISLNPQKSTRFAAAGGTGAVAVSATEGCNWAASVGAASWIQITSDSKGTGPWQMVQYNAASNPTKKTRAAIIKVKATNAKAVFASYKVRQLKGPATHMLAISNFGKGGITDNLSKINCGLKGNQCSSSYYDGQAITLTANPSSGWILDHWIGCDSVNGNHCAITMSSDKTVYPTFSTVATTLKPNVKVLDSSTVSLLLDQQGSTYIFDISASDIANLQPGDIIISQVGNGFARKVQSVSVLPGSSIFVETSDATLEDIIQDGTVIQNQKLTMNDVVTARPLLKGARLRKPKGTDSGLTIDLDSTVGPLDITGSTTLDLTPDLAVSADPIEGITEFKSAMIISDETNLTLSSSTNVSLIDQEIPVYSLIFAPILAGPVVLVPEVEIKLLINGEADAKLTAGVTYSEATTVGVHYTKSQGWTPINDYSKNIDVNEPTLTGSVDLKGGVGADTDILIYGVAGPYANFEAYMEAQASATVSTSQSPCADWGLYFGVNADAGAEIQILSWTLAKYGVNLFDDKWPIEAGQACEDILPPSVPANLVATPISSSEIQLAWDNSTDDVTVEGYHINRDSVQIGQAATNFFADTNLIPATQYCYSVSAFDPAQNESPASAVVCATTKDSQDTSPPTVPANLSVTVLSTSAIQLTWSAASDNIGIAGYKVYRDSSSVISTAALSADDTGLSPSTSYCYSVSAYDSAGNESKQSDPVCVTTKTTGLWTAQVKCEGQDYQVAFNLDLDEAIDPNIHVSGSGADYDGTQLDFVLSGIYDNSTATFDGNITWTFQDNSCIREDGFSAYLGSGDSGDVAMNQAQVCGCTADIRFSRSGGAAAMAPIRRTGSASFFGRKSRNQ